MFAVFQPKFSGDMVSQVVPEFGGKYIGSSGGVVQPQSGSPQEMNRMLNNRLIRLLRLLDILDILDFLDC
jgi:hypothetical protein